jgi:hypothetical protein
MPAKPRRKPEDFTPALYDLLTTVGDARVVVTRDGALHAHGEVTADDGRKTRLDGNQMNRLYKLYEIKLIDYTKRGLYGVTLGDVVLTDAGHDALEAWTVYAESLAKR